MQTNLTADTYQGGHSGLNERLHEIGWGLLLVITGVTWLVPKVPEGAWLAGVAAVLLGINLVRYWKAIPISGFSLILGLFALAGALTRWWTSDLPLLAICLVVIGVSLVVKPLLSRSSY